MIEFDLEKAKAGAKVCTKKGFPVRIICFDMKDYKYPLVALVDSDNSESICTFTKDGKQYTSSDFHDFDLMLVEEEKEKENKFSIEQKNGCIEDCAIDGRI